MTTPSEVIGRQVRRWRAERQLTVAALAARCALAGCPDLNKTVITNIENARRGDVSVDRLFALALALQVEPAQLLVPDGASIVNLTPTHPVAGSGLLRWISGAPAATGPPIGARRHRWTASLHSGSATDATGVAVVIDSGHLLTVGTAPGEEPSQATFPAADDPLAFPVPVRVDTTPTTRGLVMVELLGPLPAGIIPAELRVVPATELQDVSWTASTVGQGGIVSSEGTFVRAASHNQLELVLTEGEAPAPGTPLFSPDHRAVVALADRGGTQALVITEPPPQEALLGNTSRLLPTTAADGVYGLTSIRTGGTLRLATVGAGPVVDIRDPDTGRPVSRWVGHESNVNAVCQVRGEGESEVVASAGDDGTIRLWNAATGRVRQVLTGHESEIYCLATLPGPDGDLLASAGNDRTIRIWDPRTGRVRRRLEGHRSWIRWLCAVEAGPGQVLASAGAEPTIRLWEPVSGNAAGTLTGHTDGVFGLCVFELGGRQVLASAGADRTIRVWDLATGAVITSFIGHRGVINALCPLTLDGRPVLASAGADHRVRIWDAVTDRPLLDVDVGDEALAVTEVRPGLLAVGTLTGLRLLAVQ